MNIFNSKKAAEMRSSAAMVVLIIGVIIVAYLTILTPSDREQVLNGGVPDGTYGGGTVVNPGVSGQGVLLLSKFVGELDVKGSSLIEHNVPSTTIFTATNTRELQKIDNLYIKNSPFSKIVRSITFNADVGNSNNYLLSFNAAKAQGMLHIYLNNVLIYSEAITTTSPAPINLPSEYVYATNNITFVAEEVGWEFWRANEYELSNILVSADVTDYSSSRSEQTFAVATEEYEKLENSFIEYVPECNVAQAGRITILLNRDVVYSGFADCGVLNKQEIAVDKLNMGTNYLSFISEQGSYLIDRIKIITALDQKDYPTYYFNLPHDMFAQASTFNGRVVMTLRFSDMQSMKRGVVNINGFQDSFETKEYYFQATLDPNILQPGPNSVMLAPTSDKLHIAELRVELLG